MLKMAFAACRQDLGDLCGEIISDIVETSIEIVEDVVEASVEVVEEVVETGLEVAGEAIVQTAIFYQENQEVINAGANLVLAVAGIPVPIPT